MPSTKGELLSVPMAVFATGRPNAEADRVSDALLDLRPGLLFVFDGV